MELDTRTITAATRDGATRPNVLGEVMSIFVRITATAGAPAGASSS